MLLASGLNAMERFFPGLRTDLAERGACQRDMLTHGRWFVAGNYYATAASGIVGSVQSRPLLEGVIRERLCRSGEVAVQDGVTVDGLMHDVNAGQIVGVTVRRPDAQGPATIPADLVVDASGRGSRTPDWLGSWGYPRPAEQLSRIDVGYASRTYRRPRGPRDDVGVLISADPPEIRGGTVIPIEGDRWMVTLTGALGDHPPADEAGFVRFAGSLGASDVFDLIRAAEPASAISTYRFPASRRRRYGRLRRFPDGLLVTGDALCSFNPVYGQGMAVAALQAQALDAVLRHGRRRLARRFFRRADAILATPWRISVGGDLRYPQLQGRRTATDRLFNSYVAAVHRAAHADPAVSTAFLEVTNLLSPPSRLMRPRVLLSVLQAARQPGGPRLADSLPLA